MMLLLKLSVAAAVHAFLFATQLLSAEPLEHIKQDLSTPPAKHGDPAPGRRVKQVNRDYAGSGVYHLLYLPTDWQKGKKYPVICEYAGNRYGNSPGTVEGSNLGYGISGGKGVIWVCLPFIDAGKKVNSMSWWWSDVEATVAYCGNTVKRVCTEFGGDSNNIFLAGFSRGAIACNYIGLHDDKIATVWRGFICHSHYDGVKTNWGYAACDRQSALERLNRLGDRPQFISSEKSIEETRNYLKQVYPKGNFTFMLLPYPAHTDRWVLRETPERKILRGWFQKALKK